MNVTRKAENGRVEAVDLALTVMSTLASSQGMSTAELASKVGATPELLAGILRKLVDRSFVFKDLLDLYWLGPQLYYLGGHLSERTALVQAASDALEWIVAETHDSAAVLMREQLDAVLAMSRGSRELWNQQPMAASRGPLHQGAGSKVLLAHAPQEVIDQVIDAHIGTFTPTHIRTRDAAIKLLETIRQEGLYISRGEAHPDIMSVSAPVRNAHGQVVAALVVLCFKDKFTDQHRVRLMEVARTGARRISSRLG
jgi:IclR family transcriptional regulator, KDG regulon repressor